MIEEQRFDIEPAKTEYERQVRIDKFAADNPFLMMGIDKLKKRINMSKAYEGYTPQLSLRMTMNEISEALELNYITGAQAAKELRSATAWSELKERYPNALARKYRDENDGKQIDNGGGCKAG